MATLATCSRPRTEGYLTIDIVHILTGSHKASVRGRVCRQQAVRIHYCRVLYSMPTFLAVSYLVRNSQECSRQYKALGDQASGCICLRYKPWNRFLRSSDRCINPLRHTSRGRLAWVCSRHISRYNRYSSSPCLHLRKPNNLPFFYQFIRPSRSLASSWPT